MPPFESSLASRIGPPGSPPHEGRKPYYRNRVWLRERDETVPSHSSLMERIGSSSDSLLRRVHASGGNALHETSTSSQNTPSLAQRLASPTNLDSSDYQRDHIAVSKGDTTRSHMDLGQVDEFIASAIQEGARAQTATADCPVVEETRSSASEASVADLLAGVRDVDTDEERPTDAEVHETLIEDEEMRVVVDSVNGGSAGSDQGSAIAVRGSNNGKSSPHIAEDRKTETGRIFIDHTTTSVVAKALNEDSEKTSDDEHKTSGHRNLGAQGQLLNSSNNRDYRSGKFGDHSEDIISFGGDVPDRQRTEVRLQTAQPDVTLADNKPQARVAPTNPLLEEAKRLLIPVITENARLRDPDADIEMIKEKVMSLVTDEQCLEFMKLAKDVNGQMQDRQKKQEAESESSTSQLNDVSGDGVKTNLKRSGDSSEKETSKTTKISRYEGLGDTYGSSSTTPIDSVSTSNSPPRVKRTPKAPRAMLPRDERFKAQDLLRFVETDVHSRAKSRKPESSKVQHPSSSSRSPPSRTTEASMNARQSTPHLSSRWDIPITENNIQLSGLQLNLAPEASTLVTAPVVVLESVSPPIESLQQSRPALSEHIGAVDEPIVTTGSYSEHAKYEFAPAVIPEQEPTETVVGQQTPDAPEIDSIASTPRPSSPMVIDESTVEVPPIVEFPQDRIVSEVENAPQDEPMPPVDNIGEPRHDAFEQNFDDEAANPPENDAISALPEETVHSDISDVNNAPEQPPPDSPSSVPPQVVYPEDPVPGLWFAAVGRDRPDVYDIVFNVSEETAAAIDRWCKRRVASGEDTPYAYVHLLCLPVPAVSKMNEELEPTASPTDIVAGLQAIPTEWPASGKLIVQFDTATWYPGREDVKDTPIDVGPYIKPGRNSARVIQLADASNYFLVLCAGLPSEDILQQFTAGASK